MATDPSDSGPPNGTVNADYRGQLISRAVDLVQLFPAAAYAKNGADIRLAVDAVEDMFRLPDLTNVVIVAGDSRLHRPRPAVQAPGPLRRGCRGRRIDQQVARRGVRRTRHLRCASGHHALRGLPASRRTDDRRTGGT